MAEYKSTKSKNEAVKILLFDLDGVLVEPRAYISGIKRCVELLCSELGLKSPGEFSPSDTEIAFYESTGIHDVWDINNIIFGLILSRIFVLLPFENRKELDLQIESLHSEKALYENCPSLLNSLAKSITAASIEIERPDYIEFAKDIKEADPGSTHPPDIALSLLEEECDSKFYASLLLNFLKSTRNIYESYGTMLFQNIILGKEEFESTYELKGLYAGPSLLRTEDKVLLSKSNQDRLKALHAQEHLKMALYTARPSHAPQDQGFLKGYSPEAEIAAEASGLSYLPLVGMGMMDWLAAKYDRRSEDLTKPNSTHCISALFAALLQDSQSTTLELAYKFSENNIMDDNLKEKLFGSPLKIFVFEDTSSGIKPMLKLVKQLESLGVKISLSICGIANNENKKLALRELTEHIFENINGALSYAFENGQPSIK